MSLFERTSRVVRAELNSAMSQSTSPEEEMALVIHQMRSTVLATKIAIGKVPPSQATNLKNHLAFLDSQLSKAEAKRAELLQRLKKANELLEKKGLGLEEYSTPANELDHLIFVNVRYDIDEELEEWKRKSSSRTNDELEALRKQLENL